MQRGVEAESVYSGEGQYTGRQSAKASVSGGLGKKNIWLTSNSHALTKAVGIKKSLGHYVPTPDKLAKQQGRDTDYIHRRVMRKWWQLWRIKEGMKQSQRREKTLGRSHLKQEERFGQHRRGNEWTKTWIKGGKHRPKKSRHDSFIRKILSEGRLCNIARFLWFWRLQLIYMSYLCSFQSHSVPVAGWLSVHRLWIVSITKVLQKHPLFPFL